VIVGDLTEGYPPGDLLADYPLKPHEVLRDRSDRVFKHLAALSSADHGKHSETPAWLLDDDGTVRCVALGDLADKDRKELIHGRTVLLPPSAGGLNGGLLDGTSDVANDVADEWPDEGGGRRRSRLWGDRPGPEGMRLIREIDARLDLEAEGDDASPVSSGGIADDSGTGEEGNGGRNPAVRIWRWYTRPKSADDDGSRTGRRPVSWDDHTRDVVENARRIVRGLPLPEDLKAAAILAAKFHDLGKKRVVWQRSIGNPTPTDWLAKSGGATDQRGLTDYRHEFGSLMEAERELAARTLDDDTKDLVLHLIATHHGRGRPHFPAHEAFDPEWPRDDSARVAADVPRRFARLQRRYGRWGLAYLESLLRAADYAASANPTARKEGP